MSQQNYIPDDAPFTAEQRQWLNGLVSNFINDLTSGRGLNGQDSAPVVPVTILIGSQTGNSEALGKKLSKAMAKMNFKPVLVDLGSYEKEKLPTEQNVLIITSTYGDGEPPDNAADFHEWILSDAAPSLEGVNFSILSLGDTEYPDFCKCGIEFDERFEQLGATRIFPRVDCDVEFDDEFEAWKKGVLDALGASAALVVVEDESSEDGFNKKNPFPAPILKNVNLNTNGPRETHHIEFSLEGSGLKYEVGDALGVYPCNDEAIVDEILGNVNFKAKEEVPLPGGGESTLRDALIHSYDIRNINKTFIQKWQKRSGSPYLRALVESDDKAAYDDYCYGREVVDLITDHPADFSDAEEFVGSLKKLQPRLYSISSSPNAHPNEVHLTVGIVRYESKHRSRGGVCSTFLSDRANEANPGVFLHSNNAFRLPTDGDTPVIMVGPGTGIAPFRAFLEERKVAEAKGGNWLFFGNPHEADDFLYQDELTQMQSDGVLTKLSTAFSRDQKEKIYVQDRMLEAGAELWKWLNEANASFYVCGDASRMAKDVDAALHAIAQEHGGLSEEASAAFVKQLKKEKRYCRDVY
ncbi:sulfite reductase subunit alpha [Rubritalea profundi]|uniref:assimilatory sulfite reductase (NADPH) n=1 Tax=Rubritalea profundi TaxID=1658618 RepID=A0A2S7U4M8_9BACT|nr:sulfite reductase subunit alpha [Rubritalea profundi]PQJ29966.1 sulfite reductase subunit alpha [Rubritalea profundi]